MRSTSTTGRLNLIGGNVSRSGDARAAIVVGLSHVNDDAVFLVDDFRQTLGRHHRGVAARVDDGHCEGDHRDEDHDDEKGVVEKKLHLFLSFESDG